MYLQQDAWTIRILSDENSDDEPENLCVHMQSRVLADIEGERLSMSSRVFFCTPACEAWKSIFNDTGWYAYTKWWAGRYHLSNSTISHYNHMWVTYFAVWWPAGRSKHRILHWSVDEQTAADLSILKDTPHSCFEIRRYESWGSMDFLVHTQMRKLLMNSSGSSESTSQSCRLMALEISPIADGNTLILMRREIALEEDKNHAELSYFQQHIFP